MTAPYCAPASKVLTVLHIKDLDVPACEKPEPSDGATRCGLSLIVAELWVPVDLKPGDPVCRQCQGITDEEMTLL